MQPPISPHPTLFHTPLPHPLSASAFQPFSLSAFQLFSVSAFPPPLPCATLPRMQPLTLKHILMAADMPRAVAFYRDVFHLQERSVTEWWSELAFGDTIIALHGGHDGSPNPTGLSLQFDSVIDAARLIEKAGGRILTFPARREGEPLLLGQIRDPEGNELFITESLKP